MGNGEVVISEEKVEDLAESIGEEGTLSSIRSRVPKMRFDPETQGVEEVKSETVAPPETEVTEAGTEGPAQKPPEGTEKEGEATPRFASQADAEQAHAEAERRMHAATTEAALAKEAQQKAEQEATELKAKLEEAITKKPEETVTVEPVSREDRKAKIVSVAKEANLKAIQKIGSLDREAETYQAEVGEAWAEAYAEAMIEAGLGALSQAEINKMVANSVKAEEERKVTSRAEEDRTKAAEENQRLWDQAIDIAGKNGLDMASGSVERDLFEVIARRDLSKQDFMKVETPPSLKDQVDWVVKEVRARIGSTIDQIDAGRKKARTHQETRQPLVRGSAVTPPAEEQLTQPVSLASIRKQTVERQRAKHRGA